MATRHAYAVLTHELAREGNKPSGFYPKAHIFEDTGGTLVIHQVHGPAQSVSTRREADALMLPVLRRWLQEHGWEDVEIFVKLETG